MHLWYVFPPPIYKVHTTPILTNLSPIMMYFLCFISVLCPLKRRMQFQNKATQLEAKQVQGSAPHWLGVTMGQDGPWGPGGYQDKQLPWRVGGEQNTSNREDRQLNGKLTWRCMPIATALGLRPSGGGSLEYTVKSFPVITQKDQLSKLVDKCWVENEFSSKIQRITWVFKEEIKNQHSLFTAWG